MKPKPPNKRNPKPNCKSGEVVISPKIYEIDFNASLLRGERFQRFVVTFFKNGNKEYKTQYSNDNEIWID